jgi:predicted TIM-barrel fold metal-dependent hydrolase
MTGPLVDAHFHLWDRRALAYPWLAGQSAPPLARDWLAGDYAALARPAGVTAAVHLEANPADPLAEVAWLGRELPALGLPVRIVAHAPMAGPDTPALLARLAAMPGVTGIRDILTWHPDPGRSRLPDNDRMASAPFRAAMARLADLGLSFDLMISPWQAAEAEALVRAFPAVAFVLNHCLGPMDHDAAGRARWQAALARLAGLPNTAIKLSDPMAFRADWSADWVAEILGACLEAFGPDRAMFGSDWPVAGRACGFADWLALFDRATAGLGPAAQAAVRQGTAARLYRLGGSAATAGAGDG